jgi:hypothetical protein
LDVLTTDDLSGVARAAFGSRRLVSVSWLRGGSKKGAYRLFLDDDSTAIAYVWAESENYWPGHAASTPADAYDDPFSEASGLVLFSAAQRELDAAGVRTPRVYLTDESGRYYPAAVAVVEDVPGESLECLLEKEPEKAAGVLSRLAEALDAMYRRWCTRYGKVAFVRNGGVAADRSCEQVVLGRAHADLAEGVISAVGNGLFKTPSPADSTRRQGSDVLFWSGRAGGTRTRDLRDPNAAR